MLGALGVLAVLFRFLRRDEMRFLSIFLLCLLCSPATLLAQTKPVLEHKGDFGFPAQGERISRDRYLERENRLLLLSEKSFLLLNVGEAKVLENRPLNLPGLDGRARYDFDNFAISPDGRKMLVVVRTDAKDGVKQDAWIWDTQTGKQLAVLDKSPTRIRAGAWSKNGKTLVTYDNAIVAENPVKNEILGNNAFKVVLSFWDGETFEYRRSITVENITWTYLSDDGRHFLAASGQKKSRLGFKYISDSRVSLNVWDAVSGQLEKTIAVSDDDSNINTSLISLSPDGKFLVFVNKHKSKATDHRLLAWEMNGSINPKYELKVTPKIDNSYIRFSPDGKYFALDVGKSLQIYETRTGEKRFELPGVDVSVLWVSDNNILLEDDMYKMRAFEVASGKKLYEQPLLYITKTETISGGRDDSMGNYVPAETRDVVTDYTRIIPHPNGKMFLTYSNQYVKVFDSRTGVLLQTLVSPEKAAPSPDFCQKYPKKCRGALVQKADWSSDGRTLYVFHANGQTVSLWRLLEN